LDETTSSNADSDIAVGRFGKNDFDETMRQSIQELVEEAWTSVLAPQKPDLAIYWTKNVRFYEIWGNLIASHALAMYYAKEGFMISMEDILENSNMQSQAALLLSRGKK
jgi:hypothetical protein